MAYRIGDPVIFKKGPAVVFAVTDDGYVVHKLAEDGTTLGSPGNWDHAATEHELRPADWDEMPESRRPVPFEEEERASAALLAAAPPPVPGDTE